MPHGRPAKGHPVSTPAVPERPCALCGSRRGLPPDNAGGYLLVEILIAIAVFSIGFLAVGTLLSGTARNNTTGNLTTQATLLAAERLEALKNEALADLVPGIYEDPDNPIDGGGNPGGVFTRRWEIDDPVGLNTSRRVRVFVSWNRLGQVRTIELTTLTRGNGT
ncbi:MAG: hypothetical protein WHT06_15640 [Desulfobacterales bacterium]